MQLKLGWKLRSLREANGLTQAEMARVLGIENRQSLGLIESGSRKMSAEELVRAVEYFGIPLDEFATPFVVNPESRFSWRQSGVSQQELIRFEHQAGEWLAAWIELARATKQNLVPIRQRLALGRSSTFEEAIAAGEEIAAAWGLGSTPSTTLAEAAEEHLRVLVLMVDTLPGISGAACRLPEVDAVLINRNEPAFRRNFDLAHELFHVLTWEAMPPDHIDGSSSNSRRVEQLAENFASGLLMPTRELREHYSDSRDELIQELLSDSEVLGVSASALRWRLVNAGTVPRDLAGNIPDAELRRVSTEIQPPLLYSRRFMEVLALAIIEGHISVGRASKLLRINIDDLGDLFRLHEVQCPFDV